MKNITQTVENRRDFLRRALIATIILTVAPQIAKSEEEAEIEFKRRVHYDLGIIKRKFDALPENRQRNYIKYLDDLYSNSLKNGDFEFIQFLLKDVKETMLRGVQWQ